MPLGLSRVTPRVLAILGLVTSLLSIPSVTPTAHASNPACNPTVHAQSGTRIYAFTNTTLCDWTVPSTWSSFRFEIVGGGGGGGGGSWSGTTGGGGGGGGTGDRYEKDLTGKGNVTISIISGSGGAGGLGAATQGTTSGTSGSSGTPTSIIISPSESYSALAGSGGGAGNGDVGGTGGTGMAFRSETTGPPYVGSRVAGGTQNSGNGGAGSFGTSGNATAQYPGRTSIEGAPYLSLQSRRGGFGGARTGTTREPGDSQNLPSYGGSSTRASQAAQPNTGGGGGGGAGCAASESSCANKDGSAGASGYVLIIGRFATEYTHSNMFSSDPSISGRYLAVGVAPTYPVYSVKNPLGSVSWSISPALPAGISLNSSTGQLSGTPTEAASSKNYSLSATDAYGSISSYTWTMQVNKGTSSALTFNTANLPYQVSTAISASGGSGTGAITFSSSDPNCLLTNTGGSWTVTAQKSSGSCSITATKAGDANWYSTSKTTSFTMVKKPATISITSSPSSPQTEYEVITIVATVGAGQTGSVTFLSGGSPISSCGRSGVITIIAGSATCGWQPDSSGSPYTISATYSGDTNYQSATSNSISYTIYPQISIEYPNISTSYGTSKSSTPTISGGTGSSSSWTWSIVKDSDSSAVSGISINSSGVVTSSSSVSSGTYLMRVTATDSVGVSASNLIYVVVDQSGGASTAITADKNVTTVGGTIQLNATVVSGATGTIAFRVGGVNISGCSAVSISSGSATCSWTPSTASGSPFAVTAVYSGDGNYLSSTSASKTISVNPVGVFTYSSQTYSFGAEKIVSVVTSGGTGSFSSWDVVDSATGTAEFKVTINTSGEISIAKGLAAGSHTFIITATDSEGIYGRGTLQVTVTKATPTVTLSTRRVDGYSVSGGTLGRQVRLVVELSVAAGGQAVISGNSSTLCTVFIFNGAGECWWAPADASASPYSITATYNGNSDANSATSNTISNFAWNPAISVSHANTTVETGKTVTISPTISGGTGSASSWIWGISQYLTGISIGGITINSSGVIQVSGSVLPDTYTMMISAYDLGGSSHFNYVDIRIADIAPPVITISSSSETVTAGSALTGYTLTNSGSDIDSYSIDQSLPNGLSFSSSTGRITGTPTETVTSLVITLTALNFAGSDTATFTLTVSPGSGGGGGGTTIAISLAGGATTAEKGKVVVITASISAAGRVTFTANGKKLPGCVSKYGTTTVTCSWKPMVQGQNILLSAALKPTSGSLVKSSALSIGTTRRTGLR